MVKGSSAFSSFSNITVTFELDDLHIWPDLPVKPPSFIPDSHWLGTLLIYAALNQRVTVIDLKLMYANTGSSPLPAVHTYESMQVGFPG